MTNPKEMGYDARRKVEQAAERINLALVKMSVLLDDRSDLSPAARDLTVAESMLEMTAALRWLERLGAQTVPEEL